MLLLRKLSSDEERKKDRIDIATEDWNQLKKISEIFPKPFNKVMNHVRENFEEWKEFLRKSTHNLKSSNECMINFPFRFQNISQLDYLVIVKFLRPDALEIFAETLIASVRHKSFYFVSKRNLETLSRLSWNKRPLIIFYDHKHKNPVASIELAAERNKVKLSRVGMGECHIESLLEEITRAARGGYWIVLENFHLIVRNVSLVIKFIESELFSMKSSDLFKIWITYQVSSPFYTPTNVEGSLSGIEEEYLFTIKN